MSVKFLDCRDEVSDFRSGSEDHRAWLGGDIRPGDWIVKASPEMLDEIDSLARFINTNPVQDLQRRISDYSLPYSQAAMREMKQILDQGVGFAVLDRLPMDDFNIEDLVQVYWLLGQCIGRPVAQKWNGQMVYDVRDTGAAHSNRIRGSHTRIELGFHTDNAFARMVPDYVGLLCRYPAKTGGISRFCSLYTVHNRMAIHYPEELRRLYQPMYFNRQAEHHPDAPRVSLAPYFSWSGSRLTVRANSSLVRAGYQVAGEPMDTALGDALDAIDEVCSSEDIWFEAPLERGQIQYLNNHETGHYRSEFADHENPDLRRHLVRLWHRERGTTCYDGGTP